MIALISCAVMRMVWSERRTLLFEDGAHVQFGARDRADVVVLSPLKENAEVRAATCNPLDLGQGIEELLRENVMRSTPDPCHRCLGLRNGSAPQSRRGGG